MLLTTTIGVVVIVKSVFVDIVVFVVDCCHCQIICHCRCFIMILHTYSCWYGCGCQILLIDILLVFCLGYCGA